MNVNNWFWYHSLIKPSFAPSPSVFGPVWLVLYLITFLTFSYIIYLVFIKKLSVTILVPLVLNLASNFSFTPIQFVLKNNFLAAIDISVVLLTILWLFFALLPKSKLLAFTQIPYLLWVGFATVLQFSITWLNR